MAKKKPTKKRHRKPQSAKRQAKKSPRKAEQLTFPVEPAPQSVTTVDTETEKKLSTKIIVGKRIGKITEPTDLYTVAGVVTGIKVGQSTYGEWIGLRGSFEATRLADNQIMRAPLIILPDAAMIELNPALFTADLEFALLVSVDPSSNQAGFDTRVTWIVEPRAFDGLARMREALRYCMTGASS
jgi:hypothetical protein